MQERRASAFVLQDGEVAERGEMTMPKQLMVKSNASSKWTYVPVVLLSLLLCMVSLMSTSDVAMALPKPPDEDEDAPLFCDLEGSIQATLRLEGPPITGSVVQINATNAKIELVEPNPSTPKECEVTFHSLFGKFQWELPIRPLGSTANLSGTSTLTTELRLDVAGQYRVRFIVCPDECDLPLIGGGTFPVPPVTRDLSITAVEELHLPPETEPILPPQTATSSTPLSNPDASEKCGDGGGFIDPQWVTVNEWHGAQDYELLEGEVRESRISRKDNFLNHDSQDFLIFVDPDPPHDQFRRPFQGKIEVEWERDHFPEVFRPTRGDRVSVIGYWILDCGHGKDGLHRTEIHPPVMVATHRARPIQIPIAEGFGSNVFVPGILTDIWINQDAGETTRNCSLTGLHQPSGGTLPTFGPHLCLPQTEVFERNPIDRIFEFNIYLPRNPQAILAEVGRLAPPVPLYREVLNRLGGGGPDPVIFLCPDSGPDICDVVIDQSDVTYLKVRLDLRNFTGRNYSRQIASGWTYPDPDNWGLKRWKLRINSMNVHNDGDSKLRGDGDWRFWANTNNGTQEWTKLFDCDGCVHGTETFSGRPWETGSADPNRNLGPHLLLFPGQDIWVHTSGFEEDWVVSDSTGHVSVLALQLAQAFSTRSKCKSSGSSGCADYTLNFEILEGAAVDPANLSEAGQAIHDAYIITTDDPFSEVGRLPLKLERVWNLPIEMVLLPKQPPVSLDDTNFFDPQGVEVFALTDISVEEFNRVVSAGKQARPELLDRALNELREEVDLVLSSPRAAEVKEELTVLLDTLPEDLRNHYFGDIEVDDAGKSLPAVWWVAVVGAAIVLLVLFWLRFLPYLRRKR